MQNKKAKAKSQNLPRTSRVKKVSKNRKPGARRNIPMIGLAPKAKNFSRPGRVTTRSRADGATCRIKGNDFLTSVNIGGSAASAGDVLCSFVVNPSQLGLARLATMAKLYERYKFRSLKFRYSPVANATVSGQLLGYVDYDTYDDPTGLTGIQNLQRAGAHYGEKPVQVWQGSESPVFWEIKDLDPMTDLYVDSDGTDPRWTNQGRFVLLAASTIASSTACGNIYLDYDIEFYIPQLELTPTFGFANSWVGGGVFTAARPLGSIPVAKTWNNLPVTLDLSTNNQVNGPPGVYLLVTSIVGTVITDLFYGSSDTSIYSSKVIASDAKSATLVTLYSATESMQANIAATATTVTASQLFICLCPSNAITLDSRKMAKIGRAVKLLGDVNELKSLLETMNSKTILASKETKEEKEAKASDVCEFALKRSPETTFLLSQSTSSVSSVSTGCGASGSWFHS